MATINVRELRRLLAERGEPDAEEFLEITFHDPARRPGVVDEEFKDRVLTVDCAYGNVVITFDEWGELRSLDIS